MSPAILPWWGWLLCATAAIFAAYIATLFTADQEPKKEISITLSYICGVTAIICWIIGIILFVK